MIAVNILTNVFHTLLTIIADCEALPIQHFRGHFLCQAKNYASGSPCKYSCSGSNVPEKATSTTCKPVSNSSGTVIDYKWDPKVENDPGNTKFKCVPTMK